MVNRHKGPDDLHFFNHNKHCLSPLLSIKGHIYLFSHRSSVHLNNIRLVICYNNDQQAAETHSTKDNFYLVYTKIRVVRITPSFTSEH